MRYLFMILLAAIVTATDQYTKHMTIMAVKFTDSFAVTSFFNIVHVRNKGAAFGFLNNSDTHWQLWFFLGITLIALGVIFFMAKNAPQKAYTFFFALGLISGGAIGNGIDRVARGSVVDFFDFHIAGWHWPAFNVADIAICIGALLLFFIMYLNQGNIQEKKRSLP